MKITHSIIVIAACAATLAACSGATHHHAEAEKPPTLRLTLIPQGSVMQAKLNDINTRTLITKDTLTQPLQLFAVDPTLTDFHLITPQDSKIPGLYEFPFTPKSSAGYRVWADVNPSATISKTQAEEFPQTDLGAHKIGNVNKTESHDANVGGYHFALSFDKAPNDDDESIGTISVTGSDGAAVKASGEIIGFYDDFHSVLRVKLDDKLAFHLTPKKSGFIKLFAVITLNGKTLTVPFGVTVAKAK